MCNLLKNRVIQSPPGTSPVPEPVKLAIAGSGYLLDNEDFALNRKTHNCHYGVDRLYPGAPKLPENRPSLW